MPYGQCISQTHLFVSHLIQYQPKEDDLIKSGITAQRLRCCNGLDNRQFTFLVEDKQSTCKKP